MFNAAKLYQAKDPALLALAPYSTLAHWRSEGKGPPYLKLGSRVSYRGADLNEWIEQQMIRPEAA